MAPFSIELRSVNEALWDIEDLIRDCERDSDFGPKFIELARSVYINIFLPQSDERLTSSLCATEFDKWTTRGNALDMF
jgi:hypothetical protein